MNDVIIQINTQTAKAFCENNKIGVKHANLQNKLIFEMTEKINGSAWLEYEIDGNKNYAEMEEIDTGYQIDIKSCLLTSNYVNVDLKITESENANGIPIFVSTIVELDVYESINATTEEPEYYPDWKTVADSKIAEMNQLKDDVNEAINETNNLDIDINKSGKIATIELNKKDNTTKTITLSDGTNLMFNWDGTKLGIKTDEDEYYTYVDLQGIQGPMGPQGEAFQIKKTYSSISAMYADFNNMQLGDYVMIASEVEQEDNAKLYTRGESRWIFISDFSGAQGIKGETGATPNIQIGTVISGNSPSVTRTGTNENPILNFVLEKGEQGIQGETGETGATGNGIATIEKTGTIDNIDTYTITYTNGNTTTFSVTNSTVTNQEFDSLKNKYNALINTLPKINGSGETIVLNNTSDYFIDILLKSRELSQDGTPTPTNPVPIHVITGSNNIKISNSDNSEYQNFPITLSSKNLLDFNNITVGRLGPMGTVTVDGDIITFTANNQTVYGVEIDLKDLNLKPNTTYTVSNLYENTGSFGGSNGWRYYDGTSYTVLSRAKTYFNFTTGDGTTNKLYFYLGSPFTYTGTLTLYNIQLLEGLVPQADIPNYAPYIANPLEYCKIENYADQIFKNIKESLYYDNTLIENDLYMKKNVGKIDSYDGETISTDYISTTGGLDTGATIYYGLSTLTYIHITETDYPVLYSQLEDIYNNAKSYNGQTNITQTNDGLPFNIELSALRDLSTL